MSNKGYIYYNNGEINRKFRPGDIIPEGFVKGVLPIKDWVRVKISEAKKGHKVTQEQKDKQSSTMKTRYKTGEIVPHNKGKHLSEATRLKLSEINKNKKYSKEVCIKKSTSMKGKNKGKIYINKEGIVKSIPKFLLNTYLENGWERGNLRKGYPGTHYKMTQESIDRCIKAQNDPVVRQKIYLTKKANGTLNCSKPEMQYKDTLIALYGEDNVITQYKETRYPFNCDFYIKSEDKFIELNLHWTHGKKPYNPNDKECQEKLKLWEEKAKVSKFYANAIQTWAVRDVNKLAVAKQNNLNYEVIYNV